MPKPAPRQTVRLGQHTAERLATAQGYAFTDITADREAADAHDVADQIDARRDPLVVEMTRLFNAIEHDLMTSAASRALATRGKGLGLEAIRLDRLIAEHTARERREITASIEAGRAVVAVQDDLLTGRSS